MYNSRICRKVRSLDMVLGTALRSSLKGVLPLPSKQLIPGPYSSNNFKVLVASVESQLTRPLGSCRQVSLRPLIYSIKSLCFVGFGTCSRIGTMMSSISGVGYLLSKLSNIVTRADGVLANGSIPK